MWKHHTITQILPRTKFEKEKDMIPNTITLFSNGIGHFKRNYKIPANENVKISIPFNTEHISDVLESLTVFGEGVKLDSPPSFIPSNSDLTSLTFSEGEGYVSLLRGLSGAEVSVQIRPTGKPVRGTLVGVEQKNVTVDSKSVVTQEYLVLESNGNLHRYLMTEVEDVQFLQETVKSEIQKALKAKFTRIKPNSTMMELSVSSTKDTNAIVFYKIPVASWKMRYGIRQDKNAFLDGSAIVDNNTDEDWNDFIVSVVTGNPISFKTDLGMVVVPHREFVKIVDDNTLGNVNVREAAFASAKSGSRSLRGAMPMAASAMALSNVGGFEAAAFNADASYDAMAEAPGMDSKDVGDFCVFTAKEPVSISSKRSAIIPMFGVDLKTSSNLLYYKPQNHASRPYRAFKFKNETPYSLSKGKVVVYQQGLFSGECVMETTKPGENRTLAYCLENGVKVNSETGNCDSTVSSLRLAKGYAFDEIVDEITTKYSVSNKKNEAFKFMVEHKCNLGKSKVSVSNNFTAEKLVEDTWRVYFDLPANETIEFELTETCVRTQKYSLNSSWIISNSDRLDSIKELRECLSLSKQIAETLDNYNEQQDVLETLESSIERVRENLKVVTSDTGSSVRSTWITELNASEGLIKEVNSKLAELKKKQKQLEKQLGEKLAEISVVRKN